MLIKPEYILDSNRTHWNNCFCINLHNVLIRRKQTYRIQCVNYRNTICIWNKIKCVLNVNNLEKNIYLASTLAVQFSLAKYTFLHVNTFLFPRFLSISVFISQNKEFEKNLLNNFLKKPLVIASKVTSWKTLSYYTI